MNFDERNTEFFAALTIAQAERIASEHENDDDWDFWEYLERCEKIAETYPKPYDLSALGEV